MSKAKSGGGATMNKVVQRTTIHGSPNTCYVPPSGASHIGRAVGTHVTDGREVQRNDPPMYKPAPAPTRMGNDMAKDVGRGRPGAARTVHSSGSQGQHGQAAGTAQPQGRDILSEFGPESK
jgi:hypothetical protein